LLGRSFAGGTGDRYHASSEGSARCGRNLAERVERIADLEHNWLEAAGQIGDRPSLDHDAGSPALEYLADEIMTVAPGAANRDEQLAGADLSRVDRDPAEAWRGFTLNQLATCRFKHLCQADTHG
jgi:hypothetical protein